MGHAMSSLPAIPDSHNVFRLDCCHPPLNPFDTMLHALKGRIEAEIVLRTGISDHPNLLTERLNLGLAGNFVWLLYSKLHLHHLAPMMRPHCKKWYTKNHEYGKYFRLHR